MLLRMAFNRPVCGTGGPSEGQVELPQQDNVEAVCIDGLTSPDLVKIKSLQAWRGDESEADNRKRESVSSRTWTERSWI